MINDLLNLVGGFKPFEKYAQVKLDDFPMDWGEKEEMFETTTYK